MEAEKVLQSVDETAVRGYLLRKLPFQEVDDAYEEILVRLFEFSSRVKSEGSLPAAARTIAGRVVAGYYRDANNHRNRQIPVVSSREPYHVIGYDSAEYEANQPDKILEGKEIVSSVRRALASFDPHLAHLLHLTYFEGFSYQQIADCLGIPLGTVKSRLRKAKIKFRKLAFHRDLHKTISG